MKRMVRVNELVKREVSGVLERLLAGEMNCLITVTAVDVSPDLRQAHVYVSVYGGDPEAAPQALAILRQRRGEIQRLVSRGVTLKYTPVLHFHLDEHAERAERIMHLLDTIEQEEKEP